MTEPVTVTLDPKDMAKELGPAADAPIGPCIGVASIALNMAMKFHDITTVQDGTLYQQYKLEGKNMHPIHLDYVLETALQIEKHLIGANKRVSALMVASFIEMDEAEATANGDETPPADNEPEKPADPSPGTP